MSTHLARQAELATRALLSRSASHDTDPYERVMRDCLSSAHAALGKCPPGPLRDRLKQELSELARCCARDAEEARAIAARSGRAADRAQALMARRIADAAHHLSLLAGCDEVGVGMH
ncbi:MAG: hypothetical protein H6932_14665 [Burkholderiaceae bacterium]|nr:hypothetical protein [Burkholderiaceae bacterium]